MKTTEMTDEKLQQAVLAALPGKHLAIWAFVRLNSPKQEVSPSEVYRCLANCPAVGLDLETGVWSRRG